MRPKGAPSTLLSIPKVLIAPMPTGVKINKATWIAVWIIAVLLTVVGGISPAESTEI